MKKPKAHQVWEELNDRKVQGDPKVKLVRTQFDFGHTVKLTCGDVIVSREVTMGTPKGKTIGGFYYWFG